MSIKLNVHSTGFNVLFGACLWWNVSIRRLTLCVGQFENIPLGNAYARDEDDWDVGDKTFSFAMDNDIQFFRYVAQLRKCSAILMTWWHFTKIFCKILLVCSGCCPILSFISSLRSLYAQNWVYNLSYIVCISANKDISTGRFIKLFTDNVLLSNLKLFSIYFRYIANGNTLMNWVKNPLNIVDFWPHIKFRGGISQMCVWIFQL